MRPIGIALPCLALAFPARSALADELVSVADPTPCTSTGGVVGRRVCPPYGIWAAPVESPYVFVTFGVNFRRPGSSSTPASIARVVEPEASATTPGDTSVTIVERIAFATSRLSYVGLEAEIAPDQSSPNGTNDELVAGGFALAGVHGGSTFAKLGVEIAGGVHFLESEHGTAARPLVEARARAEIWVTPWFTLGAVAGTNPFVRGDWVLGVHLGVHSRSYGGMTYGP